MTLEDQYRILIGGYYGVQLMDSYPLKEYLLKDIEKYMKEFLESNPIPNFSEEEEKNRIKEIPNKRKLQDALLLLNKMNGPMDLVFLIKEELKKYSDK